MLIIRLSRIGKKSKPQYRILVQEKTQDPQANFLEQVGFYNPHTKPPLIQLKEDRIKYWLSKGAHASPTVFNMLVKNKIVEGKPIPLGRPKKKKEKEVPQSKESAKPVETEKKEVTKPAIEKPVEDKVAAQKKTEEAK